MTLFYVLLYVILIEDMYLHHVSTLAVNMREMFFNKITFIVSKQIFLCPSIHFNINIIIACVCVCVCLCVCVCVSMLYSFLNIINH